MVPARAALVTTEVSHIRFAEKLHRTPRFEHRGPILGDQVVVTDAGTFNFQGTLSLEGVDLTQITPDAVFVVAVYLDSTPVFDASCRLSDDPTYRLGKRRAVVRKTATYKGRVITTMTITLKADPLLGTLRVSIIGNYRAETRNSTQAAGKTVLAGTVLGQPTRTFRDSALVLLSLFEPTEGGIFPALGAEGVGSMVFGGRVITRSVRDPRHELPNAIASQVAIVGTSPR